MQAKVKGETAKSGASASKRKRAAPDRYRVTQEQWDALDARIEAAHRRADAMLARMGVKVDP